MLLDRSVVLTKPPAAITYVLCQLSVTGSLMGTGAHAKAYALKEDLQAAAEQHQNPRAPTAEKYRQLLNDKKAKDVCCFLDPSFISSKVEPKDTRMLRNAKKVNMTWEAGVHTLACCETARVRGDFTSCMWHVRPH
jgi:hypothetical protein